MTADIATVRLRPVTLDDAADIAAIYAHYVEHTIVTFEEEAPDAAEMARRIEATVAAYPWLVAEQDGALVGYAYGRPYHARAAYRWTCETGIYLAPDRRSKGTGRALYAALLDALAGHGFITAIAAISVPNDESTRFHEALGFVAVGRFAGVGFKHGAWQDVGYWQRDFGPRPASPHSR
jgi:phosphinothricin acetyltransferase